eukprot:TRINITY_DN9156_c0_g1_i1.p1 TRINITY_DN9156_c0_g1~~TRINITY_DN9156_c0_g1_i1.p1  ORF type:complete len:286 (+),score=33.32 TRINITY_DN9156_c0_g1_i1:50-859(+)
MFGWLSGPDLTQTTGSGNTAAQLNLPPCSYPELATPKTKEEYINLTDTTYDYLLPFLISQDGWESIGVFDDDPDIRIFRRDDLGESVNGVRIVCTLPVDPKKAIEIVCGGTTEDRQKWDADMIERSIRKVIDDDHKLVRIRYGLPFPITNREFLYVASRRFVALNLDNPGAKVEEEDIDAPLSYINVTVSINCDEHRADPNYVRGVNRSLQVFTPVKGDPNKTMVSRIFVVDPKGLIPSWVVNQSTKKGGYTVMNLKKYMREQQALSSS